MGPKVEPQAEPETRLAEQLKHTLTSTALDLTNLDLAIQEAKESARESAIEVKARGHVFDEEVTYALTDKFLALLREPGVERMSVQEFTGALGSFFVVVVRTFSSAEGLCVLAQVLNSTAILSQALAETRLVSEVITNVFSPGRKDN